MKIIYIILLGMSIVACSSTSSSVRRILESVDHSSLSEISLALGGNKIQTSSQGNSKIYKLHHQGSEVAVLAEQVAKLYGFNLVELEKADFYLDLNKAVADGGACVSGMGVAARGLSFTASILTLGVVPATGSHCLEVNGTLYRIEKGERTIVGKFMSNAGRVEVTAGANEVDNYRLVVDREDEVLALEASIGGLFNALLAEKAFQIEIDY